MKKKYKQTTLYLPLDVYERLKLMADEEHRSVNSQVVHLVSDALPFTDLPATIRAMKKSVEQG